MTTNLNDLPIAVVPLADMKPADFNPNHMTEADIDNLAESIRTVGFLQPVLLRKLGKGTESPGYEIVDGHQRTEAARRAGLDAIPAVITSMSVDAAKAVRIGMDKLRGQLSISDVSKVIDELITAGWTRDDLGITGFRDDELDDVIAVNSRLVEDVIAEAAANIDDDFTRDTATKAFVLEIEFADKASYTQARKRLRRAAGKGGSLADGLLAVLGEETNNAVDTTDG